VGGDVDRAAVADKAGRVVARVSSDGDAAILDRVDRRRLFCRSLESAADREHLRGALGAARGGDEPAQLTFFTIRPYEFQEEILDRLRAERELHGRQRNLVVAATGTGKTVIAAFDYVRRADGAGVRPRLLFLAHRRELLLQARDTFRHVLRDGSFAPC
jgi:superfamily II DNA or RNA helicase